MALEEVAYSAGNPLSILDILQALPPEIIGKFSTLITILQAASIAFIIYVIFLIVTTVINVRRNRAILRIEENTRKMNENLEKFLKRKK